jgi:hypothetical protein
VSSDELVDDITAPLPNGAELPKHPAATTSYHIVRYGEVRDASDGLPLKVGLHANELALLMSGQQAALTHLYLYAIRADHIYHTRPTVTVDVECQPA